MIHPIDYTVAKFVCLFVFLLVNQRKELKDDAVNRFPVDIRGQSNKETLWPRYFLSFSLVDVERPSTRIGLHLSRRQDMTTSNYCNYLAPSIQIWNGWNLNQTKTRRSHSIGDLQFRVESGTEPTNFIIEKVRHNNENLLICWFLWGSRPGGSPINCQAIGPVSHKLSLRSITSLSLSFPPLNNNNNHIWLLLLQISLRPAKATLESISIDFNRLQIDWIKWRLTLVISINPIVMNNWINFLIELII